MTAAPQLVPLAQVMALLPANAVVLRRYRNPLATFIGWFVVLPVLLFIAALPWLPADELARLPVDLHRILPRQIPVQVNLILSVILVAILAGAWCDWRLWRAGQDVLLVAAGDRLWIKLRQPLLIVPPPDRPDMLMLPRGQVSTLQPYEGWRSYKRKGGMKFYRARVLDIALSAALPADVQQQVRSLRQGLFSTEPGMQPFNSIYALCRNERGDRLRLAFGPVRPDLSGLVGQLQAYWPVAAVRPAREAQDLEGV